MILAGISIRDDLILELAKLLDDDDLADRLEDCYRRDINVVALEIHERETIIRSLDDPAAELEELRAVLVAEHVGRKRDGLA